MNITLGATPTDLASIKAEALLVFCTLDTQTKTLGKDFAKLLGKVKDDFPIVEGGVLVLRNIEGIAAKRVVIVKSQTDDLRVFYKHALAGMKAVNATTAKQVNVVLNDTKKVGVTVRAFEDATYRYNATKKYEEPVNLNALQVLLPNMQGESEIKQAQALAQGVRLTKQLGDLPSNICTPSYLAETALQLGKKHKIEVKVLERKQIEALRMGAFISVTQGSKEPPKFIIMEYQGATKKDAPHVLVGKGITFDTGGISIKPSASMDEMKYDMCGAASVLGVFETLGYLRPKINVVGLIPTCENMPSGTATKPGDVVTTMSGQTVEILNTDAEGRLILCDALTYSERYEPKSVVDIATLTGACVIALGHVNTGLFTRHDELAQQLILASQQAVDPCWRMPLEDEYSDGLKSRFADVANVAGREGGSITAACYLQRFAKKLHWAHLDIAGTAWNSSSANKGATGRPVPLLVEYLLGQVA